MDNLKVYLENCYGISSLDETFDLSSVGGKAKAYSIYAPNGLMKTSLSRTFDALSKGEQPKEERFNRQSVCIVEVNNIDIQKEQIYVLKSEMEISSDNEAVTNILINQERKARYDSLVSDIDKLKSKLETSLQKKSKIKKDDIENILKNDFQTDNLVSSIKLAKEIVIEGNLEHFIYNDIFDPKAISILESPEFLAKSNEFNQRYQELFDQAGTIYSRGIFNPAKADTSFNTLNKQGYFAGGHKVHLKGDASSIDYEELQEKMRIVHESIDSDTELKKLRENLAKNVQTQALISLLEKFSAIEIDLLLHNTKPDKQAEFKRCLWAFYIQNSPDSDVFLEAFSANQAELHQIELDAATEAPNWYKAIDLFNNRFVDMPFTLSLFNQIEAALGRDKAKLKFTFKDGDDQIDCTRNEIKSLSQGENGVFQDSCRLNLYLSRFFFYGFGPFRI